ncbi:hypothetical protein IRJ41_011699 [Triplophysa rosa]|uniref:Uncharacterized protein n=1 Tax=Triplophysa rosa TaxID=992332 RepID=A0A9W7W7K6_TRIRA|nr:hypothetical protein IRJ41_011699 [Triplophysa rosa]
MEDLLKLLRLCCGDAASIPRSKYMLEKAFEAFVDKSEYHHYCGVCNSYIGLSVSKDSELKCQICSSTQTVRQSLELGQFFICMPLRDQLTVLLENEPITNICNDQSRGGITDVYDGKLYKYLKSVDDSFLSLSFNCDGVPVFKSSKFSIWPLLCSVNEVPPEERDKNVLLCALWFGSSKPLMTTFLKPFVEECKSLRQTGLQWQDPVDHSIKTVKVYALCAICDAVARPLLQNFKQFNGEYGCGHCLHPGVQVRKGKGTVRVYPCLKEMPDLRDHDTTVQIGEIAKNNENTILGIKGPSPIVDLPNFVLINGMVPDYMHCVLLGVCRQIASLWFDSKSYSKPWYIGLNTARVDGNLLAIKPPSSFSRIPRSIVERKFWKAHEWQNWLLYYSLPVLKGILPNKYLCHWALLVEGVSILLGSDIGQEDIDHAHQALELYVKSVQSLYGEDQMTYNVHSILHLTKSVENLGPLWAQSAFMFESYNGYLLKQVKSSNAVPQQICKRVAWSRALPRIAKVCSSNDVSPEMKSFYTEMTSSKHHVRNYAKYDRVTALGVPKIRPVSENDVNALHAFLDLPGTSVGRYYKIIVVNGEVIHSQTYTKTKKRNNSVVILKDGSIFKVSYFLCVSDDEHHLYAIGKFGNCTVQKLVRGCTVKISLTFMRTVHFPTGFERAVDSNDIVRPCIYINCEQCGPVVCEQI